MDGTIDLHTLTKEQLIALVQVRWQALQMHGHADQVLIDKLVDKAMEDGDVERYITAKNEILGGLMTAEEQIVAGYEKPPLAN